MAFTPVSSPMDNAVRHVPLPVVPAKMPWIAASWVSAVMTSVTLALWRRTIDIFTDKDMNVLSTTKLAVAVLGAAIWPNQAIVTFIRQRHLAEETRRLTAFCPVSHGHILAFS